MNIDEAPELDYETVLKETEKAWQIKFSSTEIHWIPKSQGRMIGKILYIARWIMKEKGLQDFEVK